MPTDTILSVRDLTKVYRSPVFRRGGFKAIDSVSLTVGRGTVFGLLGPNGAGKTTLIKVLLDLARDYQGEALLFGLAPRDPRSRRKIGYLPEAHRLPGYLTGRQVMHLFGALAGAAPERVEERTRALLDRVEMTKSADRKVREYSKGMQQRIGLAVALVNDPELVFLDEPTDGVDPVGRAQIRELVLELKRSGVTLFINSHLLMEVELICDRVVIMDKGRVLREGTIDELTPRANTVRFELARAPADIASRLAGLGRSLVVEGDAFEVQATDDEVDAAIDRLRAASVSIRGITRRRATLEQSFIDLVQHVKKDAAVRP